VLRRIFGPKRDEVSGGRRKMHNEELRDLYSLPSIIRIMMVIIIIIIMIMMRIGYWWESQRERDH
jgi:hypothetical protein